MLVTLACDFMFPFIVLAFLFNFSCIFSPVMESHVSGVDIIWLFLVDTVCVQVLSETNGVEQLLLSAVCLVQEAVGTSGACCRCSFPCYQPILCTRLCVHDSRQAAHSGSRKSHVFISSHTSKKKLNKKEKRRKQNTHTKKLKKTSKNKIQERKKENRAAFVAMKKRKNWTLKVASKKS